ncbi:hypothetical protein M7I_5484 [Glarea lozoyensis 74030]|uniref:Uncharacterized protein n=1 Tax=Glarea lozoyensis (strain ATCC 74030 / MF5533) TaxID=1104152 RepID=H0ES10_GLAL7|nr:hypothetical protein M7I_5484 [Glarea lozoyensis 74030]
MIGRLVREAIGLPVVTGGKRQQQWTAHGAGKSLATGLTQGMKFGCFHGFRSVGDA